MNRIHANAVRILIVLVLGGALLKGWAMSASILAGGLLALFNHRWLVSAVDAALSASDQAKPAFAPVQYALRLVLILGTLFAMIHFSFFGLFGVLVGFSILILAGMLEALIQLVETLKSNR